MQNPSPCLQQFVDIRPPPPAGSPFSLLSLANNCGMAASLAGVQQRFLQLLRRRLCERLAESTTAAPLLLVQWL